MKGYKMAAKVEVTQSNIQKETVAQNLNISRNYQGMPVLAGEISTFTPTYTVYLGYCDNEFILDEHGERVRILSQGLNNKNLYLTQAKVGAFMMKPITVEGVETTLGELLADLMDAEILEDLNKPVVPNPVP